MKRKSIATETIMKIFIMIAVILIAGSFLLKAFNIDILGFLKGKLGELSLNPQKILYIKMDPEEDEIFAFFLRDEANKYVNAEYKNGPLPGTLNTLKVYRSVFMPLGDFPKDYCLIYTVDENDNGILWTGLSKDEGFYYYIEKGTIIHNGCGTLGACISGKTYRAGCKEMETTQCGAFDLDLDDQTCSKEADYFAFINCGCAGGSARCDNTDPAKRMVENKPFSDDATFIDWCKDNRELYCSLLRDRGKKDGETLGTYRIRYGLICDVDKTDGRAKWFPCTQKQSSSGRTSESGKKCNYVNGIGTWS